MATAIRTTACAFSAYAALLLFAAGLSAQAPTTPAPVPPSPDWKVYTYPADGFSISLPSAPDISKRNLDSDAGPIELRAYTSTDGDAVIVIAVCDYGSGAAGKDATIVLQNAKNGELQHSGSHIVSEKQITMGAYPGLQFEAENDQTHSTFRLYYVGSTLYQALVITPLNNPCPDTMLFLDSFQLIAREQG